MVFEAGTPARAGRGGTTVRMDATDNRYNIKNNKNDNSNIPVII